MFPKKSFEPPSTSLNTNIRPPIEMDNSAFRNLLSKTSSSNPTQDGTQFKQPTLGSRAKSSIPMTPRTVPGYHHKSEFARQVAEQASSSDGPPKKRFKTSYAPKGSRLANGYIDRAAAVRESSAADGTSTTTDQDDREKRLRALEEMLKLQQIDQVQFKTMTEEMGIGGDASSTHLVKGLDWKLLERVRRGEDVMSSKAKGGDDGREDEDTEEPQADGKEDVDVEEELEKALAAEAVVSNESQDHEGEEQTESTNDHIPTESLSRNEILRRLKESRNNIKTTTSSSTSARSAMLPPGPPILNDKFKKISAPSKPAKHKFTESINGRRREVLLITLKDGSTKRKTRWLDPESASKAEESGPWGMEVPADVAAKAAAMEKEEEQEDDDDIFQGIGADYDPLAEIGSGSEGEDDKEKVDKDSVKKEQSANAAATAGQKRNYFAAGDTEEEEPSSNPMAKDPTILAALKRAADIRRREEAETDATSREAGDSKSDPAATAKSSAFLQKLKERERQDAADMDFGYGGGGDDGDEEEMNDDAVFVDEQGNEYEKGGKRIGGGRKRGGKKGKRKGDKNSVGDVLGVLKGREEREGK